jgi:hypothetical protein
MCTEKPQYEIVADAVDLGKFLLDVLQVGGDEQDLVIEENRDPLLSLVESFGKDLVFFSPGAEQTHQAFMKRDIDDIAQWQAAQFCLEMAVMVVNNPMTFGGYRVHHDGDATVVTDGDRRWAFKI